MGNFRFSIRQVLLLTLLVALTAGLYSTVFRQPVKNVYRQSCVSPGGKRLAIVGTQGLEVIDLDSGKVIADSRWRGSIFAYFLNVGLFGDSGIAFIDEDLIAFEKGEFAATGGTTVSIFSISK